MDTDGTLLITAQKMGPGSKVTLALCRKFQKPILSVKYGADIAEIVRQLRQFILEHQIGILNVAGSRESQCPGIGGFAYEVIRQAFGDHQRR